MGMGAQICPQIISEGNAYKHIDTVEARRWSGDFIAAGGTLMSLEYRRARGTCSSVEMRWDAEMN